MADECANPLLLQWAKEWWDKAREQNSKGALTYKKAYESIKACPITYEHPSQAQELRGLGPKLCERLTEKLRQHCTQNSLPMPEDPRAKKNKRSNDDDAPDAAEGSAPPKKVRKTKPKAYVPSLRSGAYAIVLALSTLSEATDSGLTKNQLIEIAEAHCNSSFVAPSDPTKTYTAWSSMRTLQDKDLVFMTGGATKRYALTDDGWEVAKKMRSAEGLDNDRILNPNSLPTEQAPAIPVSLTQTVSVPSVAEPRVRQANTNRIPPSRGLDDPFICLSDSGDEELRTSHPIVGGESPKRTRPAKPVSDSLSEEPTLPKPWPKAPPARERTETNYIELISSSPHLRPAKPAKVNAQPGKIKQLDMDGSCNEQLLNCAAIPAFHSGIAAVQQAPRPQSPSKDTVDAKIPDGLNPIILPPDSYTIELLLDNREVRSKTDRTYLQDGLLTHGIKPTTRALELSDCCWVARVHDPTVLARLGHSTTPSQLNASSASTQNLAVEFVLDHLVERKRLDDLISSIKDGRFHEQKFRLHRSGAKHITYLIEEVALAPEVAQRWQAGIRSALASTLVVDQFAVVRTRKLDDSIRWLARTTRALRKLYDGQALRVLTANGLDLLEADARTRRDADARLAALRAREIAPTVNLQNSLGGQHAMVYNEASASRTVSIAPGVYLSYPAFASRAAKQEGLALRDIYLKMLLCVRGLTPDRALAVQRRWPTPRALTEAFAAIGVDGTTNGMGPGGQLTVTDHEMVSKKKREMLFRATESLPPRQRIGKPISQRVAEVWGGLPPSLATENRT